ncbi:hypothetical protein J7T55_000202 [Diaporthe amygdali]|uniref:uncharacterized protein n=1 Tax=Phomopsis amygdali TaxID=1214568 RepID=UPI0022FDF9EB|nr:uncharacterized protein J7T55_000202 [Diaporthe amygdali]KAJ0108237.1 hypothetical protein J7T55_000202 [Diaporthe amygdali]
MPSTLNAPVLQVDANLIHQVDTSNPQNLFNLWCMLSRCADALPQGRRLENLVWRLLMEEVPNENAPYAATSLPREIQRPARKSSAEDVPRLSASVDSLENDEAVEFSSDSSPVDISRPRIRRQDSCTSTRSRHISSENLEKMVSSIVEQKESLSSPLPELPPLQSPPKEEEALMLPPPELIRSGSTTTESPSKDSDGPSECSSAASADLQTAKTTVVRGFSPSSRPIPTVFTPPRATSEIPAPKSSPAAKAVESKKSRAKFVLGGSSEESYSDHGHSVETRPTLAPPAPKKKMFQIGGSSEEDSSLKSALASPRHGLLSAHKKQTSFANNLTTTIPSTSSAVIDEDDESCYDESAIDDDDEDWEDSNEEESSKNSVDEKTFFQRVDSSANLTSRRSLITLGLESNQRRGAAPHLGNVASQSTSAISQRARTTFNGPSMVASPNDSDDAPLMMKRKPRGAPLRSINEIPRSSAQPIAPTSNGVSQPIAFSPRTTRRNMMSTELTESLRRHLLWERSQKTSTANAVLKRRHTSQDVANLRQYPQQPHMNRDNNDINASSWDQDFTREAFAGYHTKGW